MYPLTLEAYPLVRPLFAELRHNLVVDSIIDGYTPAWVYVDNVEAPRTAWMWDLQGEMLISGRANCAATNRALAGLIAGKAIPHARARGVLGLTLFYDTPAWEAQLSTLLPGFEPEKAARRRYRFDRPRGDWRTMLPAGSALYRLDERWLARRDVRHMEHLVGWVDSFWRNHAHFIDASFGFFLLHGDAVASWCLGAFVSGQQVELGVATMPAYRGQGYATAVAARCVAFCAAHGLTPHWHCWEDNVASWHTAAKIGFVDPTQYMVYRVDIGLTHTDQGPGTQSVSARA